MPPKASRQEALFAVFPARDADQQRWVTQARIDVLSQLVKSTQAAGSLADELVLPSTPSIHLNNPHLVPAAPGIAGPDMHRVQQGIENSSTWPGFVNVSPILRDSLHTVVLDCFEPGMMGTHWTAVVNRCSALACAQEMPVCQSTSMMLLYTAAWGRHPDPSIASKVSSAAHLPKLTLQRVRVHPLPQQARVAQ